MNRPVLITSNGFVNRIASVSGTGFGIDYPVA